MEIGVLLLYLAVSLFYVISPGPAVFLAIANGMTAGVRALIASTLGNIIGLFVLSLVSILGLGAVVVASSSLFLFVKVIGAIYLIYLGFKQIKRAKSGINFSAYTGKMAEPVSPQRSLTAYFTESVLLAVTNPKPILFFIAIFPQFLNTAEPMAMQFWILTICFMLISFVSLLAYGCLARSVRTVFASETRMQWFHRITGGLFIIMGLGLLKLRNSTA